MRYFNPQEIKKINRTEIKNSLRCHLGKNLQDKFAINLIKHYTVDSDMDCGGSILDLGPASGEFAKQINNGYTHYDIYGVDIDNYLAEGNQFMFKEFKTADLSFDPIPWPDNTFNIVTAWCVLPHLENPFHTIREVWRVLKPNGIFIFTTPNLSSRASIEYFIKNSDFGSYRENNNHLVIFTPALIKKTVLKYFKLLDIEYHVRSKILSRGARGVLRNVLYHLSEKISKELFIMLKKRWAYNAAYVLKKKDLSDNTN